MYVRRSTCLVDRNAMEEDVRSYLACRHDILYGKVFHFLYENMSYFVFVPRDEPLYYTSCRLSQNNLTILTVKFIQLNKNKNTGTGRVKKEFENHLVDAAFCGFRNKIIKCKNSATLR